MPTYDYECQACGHTLEVFQNISEEPLVKCPECGKKKLKRLFGAGAGIIFKGSGFYQTDYRSDSYKSRAAADKPSTSGGDSGGSSDKGSSGSTGGSSAGSSTSGASGSSDSKSSNSKPKKS